MFLTLTQVALGGAIGSVLRYLTTFLVGAPLGTLIVNVVGSLVMGAALVALSARGGLSPFLLTGVLGGFTTFSAFSLEGFHMIARGQWALAIGYALASVIGSIVALAIGYGVARA